MFKKILLVALAIVVLLVVVIIVAVNTSYDTNYNETYAISDLKVEADSTMIARGKYLAHGPAHCSHCHAPFSEFQKIEAGEDVALSGGFGLEIPPGAFYAPNLTSDKETGIGNLSDGQLYRMFRYNINHQGSAVFDFMPFINMADEDIYSIIAYLRSLEPVKRESRRSEPSFLGKAIMMSGAIQPGKPDEPILKSMTPSVSKEYGEYLAYAVANCRGCHTNRDMQTLEYIGEEYAGGLAFGPDNLTQGDIYVTPNLTPHEGTGIMATWSKEKFIERMKAGRVHATSPMPWGAFGQMSDDDLKAIYLFLKSLEPVNNDVGEIHTPAES
jgi:mono/diheme cytochrome c family protein